MKTGNTHLVVIVPPELSTGYRLTGSRVVAARTSSEAADAVSRLMRERDEGVVALYEPFLSGFDSELQEALETSIAPIVVAIPSGLAGESADARRARMAAALRRSVGYHITFGEDES